MEACCNLPGRALLELIALSTPLDCTWFAERHRHWFWDADFELGHRALFC